MNHELRITNHTRFALALRLSEVMRIWTGYCHPRVRKAMIFLRLQDGKKKKELKIKFWTFVICHLFHFDFNPFL